MRANGRTSYQDCFGTVYTGIVLRFGEQAIFRHPFGTAAGRNRQTFKQLRKEKAANKMDLGIWLGKTYETDDHYTGTSDGIFTARTCRRMPPHGQWKLDAVKAVTGVPWNVGAGRPIGSPGHARVQVLPSLPEATANSQASESRETAAAPPVPPPAPPPPAPADPVPSALMTVDDEQSRVHEWRRHAKRQAEVPLEDFDPAMVLSDNVPGVWVVAWELLRWRRKLRARKKTTRATLSQGGTLSVKRVRKMQEFKVNVVVSRLEVLGKGWRVLKFRWVDKERPEVWLCRYVVKDFRALQPWRRDLFTPSSLPITNRIVDAVAESHGWDRLVADATIAFFHAAEDEDFCGECPPKFKDQLVAEGEDTDVLFKFVKKVSGRRDGP